MIIRPVTPADAKNFQDIMKLSIEGICQQAYGAEATSAWVSDDNPAFHFSLPKYAFVAEQDSQMVAVGGWSPTDTVELHPVGDRTIEKPTHAMVNAVFLKPGFEGQGLGRHLMTHIEGDIRDRNMRDIYLWSTKNAIPFYTTMGYRPGKDEHPEVAPGFKVLVRYMWKTLA